MISQINLIADKYDLVIKRAGGESTISQSGKNSMFPDVILYGDVELTSILQGWELKMPDVPITDETFVTDAQRKARALGLNSCVIWNFTYAKFYVLDENTDTFEVVAFWENLMIKNRQDVITYRANWEQTLNEMVIVINEFLLNHEVKKVYVGDIISQNAINILINDNKALVAENYKAMSARNAIIGATIDTWWEGVKNEYSLDETDKYKAYSKTIILNWASRIIFAHLIKRKQNSAVLVNDIDYDTTPAQANNIFLQITERCDFYNVFAGLKFNDILPNQTWNTLVELSMFLKNNGIVNVDQQMLQNILEKCINTSRRELNGQYPTPKILAKILAHITINDWTSDCSDPCCGTGTIPHEILEAKKSKCKSIAEAVNTTWASDKYALPLQIANISMTSSDTMNLANRIFQSNALDIHPGSRVEIVDPQNGQKIIHAVPLLGAVCSNLPFISSENISTEDLELIARYLPNHGLNERSDLSYYIALHMSEMLKDDGYMGIITSNSWLGTAAGVLFYNALLERFDLKQVHISGAGRWFQNADVVTTLLVLQKKQANRTPTNFYVWKVPLELIECSPNIQRTIINSALLGKVQDDRVLTCATYSQSEIDTLRSLNLSFNALFHNVGWLLEIRDHLIPLTSQFKIIRGSRRGWDPLFFPKDAPQIENEFLKPALFNAKGVTKLIAEPDRLAFSCSKTMEQLAHNYPGAYSWVKKFETEKNGTGKPLPQVLKKPREAWYEMQPNEVADFFTMMNPDARLFFGRFNNPTFINQRLVGLRSLDYDMDHELCHALLNSIIMKFYIEAVGFGRGLGVLDINKDSIASCYMLNPDTLSAKDRENIKRLFRQIVAQDITSIEAELANPEWKAFNNAVLSAYGIEAYYPQIVNSLISLRKVRKAVKEKFNPTQTIDFRAKLYKTYDFPTQMVADPKIDE
jgi:type I restriction-modification system DNA methylase subunit